MARQHERSTAPHRVCVRAFRENLTSYLRQARKGRSLLWESIIKTRIGKLRAEVKQIADTAARSIIC